MAKATKVQTRDDECDEEHDNENESDSDDDECGGMAPSTHKTRHGLHHQRWLSPQDQGVHGAARRAPQAIV